MHDCSHGPECKHCWGMLLDILLDPYETHVEQPFRYSA